MGPDYQGYLPADRLDGMITTRGQFVIIVGRTSILDPEDLAPLHKIQDGMRLSPLSEYLGTQSPPEPAPVAFLAWDNDKADGLGVFDYINQTLAWHPPAFGEVDHMARFTQIGVVPGQPFTTEGMDDDLVTALESGIADAKAEIESMVEQFLPVVNGWNWATDDISRLGTDYLARAAVSLKNIYPNAPDHAIYGQTSHDADGALLSGERSYTITFAPGETPPVNWFWSLTLYDATTTSMYPNPTGRTNIGDRTAQLEAADDGSLIITIQHEAPRATTNWLPAPPGAIYLVLRAYGPGPAIVDGTWTPPPVTRIG